MLRRNKTKTKSKVGSKRRELINSRKESTAPSTSGSGGKASWLETDTTKQKAIIDQQQLNQEVRAPEFFVGGKYPEGVIEFLSSDNIGMINQYTIPMGGNRFKGVTQPGPGDVNLFEGNSDLYAAPRFIYAVKNVTGYKDKQGNQKQNIPQYWVVPTALHNLILTQRENLGLLTKWRFKVVASGVKRNKTYSFFQVKPVKRGSAEKKMLAQLKADLPKYYAPPNEERQKSLLRLAEDNSEQFNN